jgi:hypothetical protein
LLEIAIGDVDSGALEFFVRSIYTDDEVAAAFGGHMADGEERGAPNAAPNADDRDNNADDNNNRDDGRHGGCSTSIKEEEEENVVIEVR